MVKSFFIGALFCIQSCLALEQRMVVAVPVTDLKEFPELIDPTLRLPTSDTTNPLQITQLLMGDHLLAIHEYVDEKDVAWVKVSVMQQSFFTQGYGWHGYTGWVQKSHTLPVDHFLSHHAVICSQQADIVDSFGTIITRVSIGTRFFVESKDADYCTVRLPDGRIGMIATSSLFFLEKYKDINLGALRASIVACARTFLGFWYSWGGRSSQFDQIAISSVDCSALIGLAFLAHGLQLPRMSHEQYLVSSKIEHAKDLVAGDLIFFNDPVKSINRMNHVMLYIGDEYILEATYAGEHKARVISFQQRLGKARADCQAGDLVGDGDDLFVVYFGSVLDSLEQVQRLQHAANRFEYEDAFYQASVAASHKTITQTRNAH